MVENDADDRYLTEEHQSPEALAAELSLAL